ncbi:hypothetical protein AB8B23_00790 [Leptotrichia sp. HSP-342]|uniref:AlwI restriction endonuclease n=1 Tax=Leptotrichia mesophila TaxID=3239303 RepID=A0AB39VBW1_9FUSO
MIKFRNPVSDMDIVIKVFKGLFSEFSNVDFFDLDNIAEYFARENLASSSGYTGNEALKRSYSISDDSRKSMKMQAKSYTELYRFLGWIFSADNAALKFSFTYLGMHIALSGKASKELFEQCLLGVIYPNQILNVKFDDTNKPFVSMLLFAESLDNKIHRDEIIIGPMNLKNALDKHEFDSKINKIKELRKTASIASLNQEIQKISDENKMQTTSVRNLTRFVISALVYTGWFDKKNLSVYGKKAPFLLLTKKGTEVINLIKRSIDIYGGQFQTLNLDQELVSRFAFLNMLEAANFDVKTDLLKYQMFKDTLVSKFNKERILFSPFQYFSSSELLKIFPETLMQSQNSHIESNISNEHYQEIQLYTTLKNTYFIKETDSHHDKTKRFLLNKMSTKPNNQSAIKLFLDEIEIMKQKDFYPLVANLLGIIFNRKAFAPPAGNNNLRYDVIIPDECCSIPVEVKSPTEEKMLSIKAIRQALENKVLLLARKPFKTEYDTSSFAIGFNIPNTRSDAYKLIDEIHQTYGINIAIMDMEELISAAFYCSKSNKHFDISEFKNKKGVIHFEYENL